MSIVKSKHDLLSLSHEQYRTTFLVLSGFIFLVLIVASLFAGISGDEFVHNEYGKMVLNWYLTGGEDQSCMTYRNLYNYGALFDTIAALMNKVMPISAEYDTRHVLTALFAFIAILFTGLFAIEVGGWRAGILALIIITLSPRFFGHSLNNPKDIPFAAAVIFTLYFLIRFLKKLPTVRWLNAIMILVGIAAAINIRVGGVLLIAYLGLFTAVFLIMKAITRDERVKIFSSSMLRPYGVLLGIPILGWFAGMIFWPYGMQDPFNRPFEVLSMMTKFPIAIRVLFEGSHILSYDLPWHYIPKWIAITTPFLVIVGFILGLLMTNHLIRSGKGFAIMVLWFTLLFPVLYAIARGSSLHDGWRHFLFIYPSMAIISALGWNALIEVTTSLKYRTIVLIFFVLLAIIPFQWMVRNHPYQYTYFNTAVGGIKGAYGDYETDYYMTSAQAALNWMEDEGIIRDGGEPTIIITNAVSPLKEYVRMSNLNAEITYGRYHFKSGRYWDYGVFVSRFIYKDHLKNKLWPPATAVHSVTTSDVPLCVVQKRNDFSDYEAEQAMEQGDYALAITYLEDAIRSDPNNHLAIHSKGLALHRVNKHKEAIAAFTKGLDIYPMHVSGYLRRGDAFRDMGDLEAAIWDYQKALELNERSGEVYNSIGAIWQARGDNNKAIENYGKACRVEPGNASSFRNRGIVFNLLGQYDSALVDFNTAISLDPDNIIFYANRGFIYVHFKRYSEALDDLNRVIAATPGDELSLNNRGVVHENLGHQREALADFIEALRINPNFLKANYNAGNLAFKLDSLDLAEGFIARALEINPNMTEAINLVKEIKQHLIKN